ncbi:MAG: hypothetical protein WD042_02320, partial [Phycisphaeraceae bacterium]
MSAVRCARPFRPQFSDPKREAQPLPKPIPPPPRGVWARRVEFYRRRVEFYRRRVEFYRRRVEFYRRRVEFYR